MSSSNVPIAPSIRSRFNVPWNLVTFVGLVILALGSEWTWPNYRTAALMVGGSCQYGVAASVPADRAWATIGVGMGLALLGLLASPRTRGMRALALAGACTVPLLLLSAGVATHFVGLEQDIQTAPATSTWWVYAASAVGACFLVRGVGWWAPAAMVLYVPVMFYSLGRYERHLDTLLRNV